MAESLTMRDASTLQFSRRVFAGLAGVALVIGGALLLFPRDTAAYFAWTIKAPIAAVTLGAWFLGLSGFAWAVSRGSRTAIRAAALATALGSTLMLLTTLQHRSAFNWGSPAAWLWLLLYVGAPPTFAAVAFRLKGDTDAVDQRARPSGLFRAAARAAVAVAGGCGAVLFLWPDALIPMWPWPLLPLGARTYAAFALGHALWAWRLARAPFEPSWPILYLAVFPATALIAPWLQSAGFRAGTLGGILFLVSTASLALLAASALWVERRRGLRS
jgi:hypothetical protein